MQEEFEKKVQERMLTFGMQPSPQVWDDIDAALGKRKHRRVFIGWWILLGLVIAGGGILFYQKDNIIHNEFNQQPVPVIDSTSHNNLAQTPAPAQEPAEAAAPVSTVNPAEPLNNSQSTTNTNKLSNTSSSTTVIKTPLTTTNNPNNLTANNTPVNSAANNTVNPANGSNNPEANNAAPNSSIMEPAKPATEPNAGIAQPPPNPQATTQQDSATVQQAATNTTTSQPATPDKKTASIIPKTITSTRHQWFFTIGGGTTQTTSFGKFNYIDNNGMSAPVTGGNLDVVPGFTAFAAQQQYPIARPKSGFHLFAGLTYQYKLAKQWRITGGVRAAYMTNTQQTGAYTTNNPFYLNNSSYLTQTNTDKNLQDGYYQAGKPGSDYSVVNKAWQLQVPINVTYVVTPRAKTKLLLNAGLSAAWTLNSRWLIPDNRYNKLYYNAAALNGTAISWQAGPAVELKNQWKFGLLYQQSFTTLAKSYVTPRLYWQNISLYAGIPFNITLKKAKK